MTIYTGDVTRWATEYDGPPFHALLSDPPYHLTSIVKRFGKSDSEREKFQRENPSGQYQRLSRGFMGKEWDGGDIAFRAETWTALARHLLPGGYLMAFGGTRTAHRLTCAIEYAGMEIRDSLAWCYLSGFPKSLDVSKAIDRAAGAEREVVGRCDVPACAIGAAPDTSGSHIWSGDLRSNVPATPEAATWAGYGTALKPAFEPITVARKPFRGTVAENCLEHGTGALAIDAGRVPVGDGDAPKSWSSPRGGIWQTDPTADAELVSNDIGRWPPNLLLDDDAAAVLDRQPGAVKVIVDHDGKLREMRASRMFHRVETALDAADPLVYQPKAATSEREAGLNHRKRATVNDGRKAVNGAGNDNPRLRGATERACGHPTVKPIDLARKLATLLLPPAEYAPRRILVPFCGVASEVIGCCLAGWDEVVGIELDPEHVSIGIDRVKWHLNQVQLALFDEATHA